jgi:acyl-coenzyme A synthetase/AMP-(fatty) acid ligase
MNAAELLLSVGKDEAVALVCGDAALTYAKLRERVARTAAWLHAHGVGAGDRVIVTGADGMAWVTVWLGTLWAGGVAVGLNPRLRGWELGAILHETGARVCFADLEAAESISSVSVFTPLKLVALEGSETLAGELIEPVRCNAEDPAFLIYSSGTTGRPKGVVHAHRAVEVCGAFAREVLGATAQDKFFATSRLFFAYALANGLFAGLRLGATVILNHDWPEPEGIARLVEHQRPTLFFSVPTFYHQMLTQRVVGRLAGADVRRFVAAGESLPHQVAQDWQADTGCALISAYGMTETLAVVLYRDLARPQEGAQPAPQAEVQVDNLPTEPDLPVRLWFRHPSVALGYFRWPDLEQRNFRDGWCSTGDLFFSRGTGQWEFAGRDDALVKVTGRWVSTLELQRELGNDLSADVQDLAVIALVGDEGLTSVALFAVPRPGRESEARDRTQARLDLLPAYQRPRWRYWLDALPRTASGKLELARLKEIHAEALRL